MYYFREQWIIAIINLLLLIVTKVITIYVQVNSIIISVKTPFIFDIDMSVHIGYNIILFSSKLLN